MVLRVACFRLLLLAALLWGLDGCGGVGTSGGGGTTPPPGGGDSGGGLPPTPGGGHTYYVSPTGNNQDPGTRERPWATPSHGSRRLKAGDTLVLMSGQYVLSDFGEDLISLESSGTAAAWITIKGEAGARPILKGRKNLFAALDVGGRNYVRIENVAITSEMDNPYSGGLREGIEVGGSGGGPGSYIVITDVEIHDIEEGGINLAGNANHIWLDRLNIHHTGMTGIGAPGAEGGRGWENVVLAHSNVGYAGLFYHGRRQIAPWDRPDGLGMEESEGPVEVHHCTFEHNRGDGLDSKSRRTHVRETIIANNHADSLKLWGGATKVGNVVIYGDGVGDPQNGPWGSIVIGTAHAGSFELINVTVDDNADRENYPIYVQYGTPTPITLLLRNCVVAHGSNAIWLGDAVTLQADHNLLYRSGQADEPVVHVNGRDYLPSEIGQLVSCHKNG